MAKRPSAERATLGWREWLGLPELGVECIKAKVDTGARTSSLHAFDVETIDRDGEPWVRFVLHPLQRDTRVTIHAEARRIATREIKSSNGQVELRPVIRTYVSWAGRRWPIEVTLTRRDAMGFRMLLGRQAVRGRFLVDPGHSFLGGRPRGAATSFQPETT